MNNEQTFICHSRKDKRFVQHLCDILAIYGIEARLSPHGTEAGERLSPVVEKAIAKSRIILVVCTPNAVQTRWIPQELAMFRASMGEDKRIVPLLVEDVDLNAIAPGLGEFEAISFIDSISDGLAELVYLWGKPYPPSLDRRANNERRRAERRVLKDRRHSPVATRLTHGFADAISRKARVSWFDRVTLSRHFQDKLMTYFDEEARRYQYLDPESGTKIAVEVALLAAIEQTYASMGHMAESNYITIAETVAANLYKLFTTRMAERRSGDRRASDDRRASRIETR